MPVARISRARRSRRPRRRRYLSRTPPLSFKRPRRSVILALFFPTNDFPETLLTMKHLKLVLLLSAVAVFAVACASRDNTPQTGNANAAGANATPSATAATAAAPADGLAAARATYNATCVKCHKENGEGGATDMGDGGTLKVPSFKSGHGLNHTDAQFARQIAKGGDGMPAFEKRLTPEQIGGLVQFIRQEFQTGLPKDGATNSSH
jgi:cytochrome c551